MIIQLLIDPRLHPELVELLEALPVRSRATKIRMMLEAHLAGESRAVQSLAAVPTTSAAGTAMPEKQTRAERKINADSNLSNDGGTGTYFEVLEGLSL